MARSPTMLPCAMVKLRKSRRSVASQPMTHAAKRWHAHAQRHNRFGFLWKRMAACATPPKTLASTLRKTGRLVCRPPPSPFTRRHCQWEAYRACLPRRHGPAVGLAGAVCFSASAPGSSADKAARAAASPAKAPAMSNYSPAKNRINGKRRSVIAHLARRLRTGPSLLQTLTTNAQRKSQRTTERQ